MKPWKTIEVSTTSSGVVTDFSVIVPFLGIIRAVMFTGYTTIAAGSTGLASGIVSVCLGAIDTQNGTNLSKIGSNTIAKTYGTVLQGTINGNYFLSYNSFQGPLNFAVNRGGLITVRNSGSSSNNSQCDVYIHIEPL